jgi:ribosomal protein RSM22 (predicted rRNA methylase)
VLEELSSASERELIIEALWEKVAPGGLFVLVEPGSPKGFRFVHDFRRWVIAKGRDQANIFAPCPHHSECPLAKEKSWCNFDQEVNSNYSDFNFLDCDVP